MYETMQQMRERFAREREALRRRFAERDAEFISKANAIRERYRQQRQSRQPAFADTDLELDLNV